ncbi:MAG TPA: LLM class flavin-dependent oxidoreductase [Candidatus Binataceae bacterium]|nr:LLM class flavin-dependent oxidoreductase [Candidatus Binataceae bacterium]
MKFLIGPLLPALPATLEERERERPIAHRTERWQRMFKEIVEVARMADDLGFEAITVAEHHLATEGLEVGSVPSLFLYIAMQTRNIKVGPVGYVLPGWNPLRLAVETAWLDQLTQGRTIVGMARGYQARWLNSMAQKLHIQSTASDQGEIDNANRRAFEEHFRILKLAWSEEGFSFKGDFWEYPYPYETGTPWPAAPFTEKYGMPGEVEGGRVRKISVVPKPYQRPHPPLFQAFSASDSTIVWCAREGVVPVIVIPGIKDVRRLAELYQREGQSVGRSLKLGEGIAPAKSIYIAADTNEALKIAEMGSAGVWYHDFGGYFGFWEAFRLPGDEDKWPLGKARLPRSEWTIQRLHKADGIVAGTVSDVRRKMDELVERVNPEYFNYNDGGDLGLMPIEALKRQVRVFGEQILPHYR